VILKKMGSTARLAAIGFLLCGGATAVSAQQPAPAAPARPPMVLPVITPSHMAAARGVVMSSGLSRSFTTIVPELMGQLFANITQTRPELTNDLKAVLTQLQPEFQKDTEQLIDAAAQAVAGQVDEPTLVQINAFFITPAGKRYVDAQPGMLSHMMDSIHLVTDQMSQQMLSRVRDELKKRGKTL